MLFFQCMPYGMTPSVRHRAIIEVPYCYFIIVMNIVYTIKKKIKIKLNLLSSENLGSRNVLFFEVTL